MLFRNVVVDAGGFEVPIVYGLRAPGEVVAVVVVVGNDAARDGAAAGGELIDQREGFLQLRIQGGAERANGGGQGGVRLRGELQQIHRLHIAAAVLILKHARCSQRRNPGGVGDERLRQPKCLERFEEEDLVFQDRAAYAAAELVQVQQILINVGET